MSRGDLSWGMGHHQMRDILPSFSLRGIAHHFKWRDGLLKNLSWRVKNEVRARVPWSEESMRLAKYLEQHGRILPADVDAVTGWRP